MGEAGLVNEPGSDGAIDKPQGLAHKVRVAGEQEAQLEGDAEHPLS
jgi:hypothetical protein